MIKKSFLFFFPTFLILNTQIVFPATPDCEVIKYTSFCELSNHRLVQTDSVILQVNTRMGENHTLIRIPYSKIAKVSNVEGWIEDETGTIIRKLKNSDITDKNAVSDYTLYQDDFVKTFQLKHNIYPYRIFYTYQTTEKQFFAFGWNPIFQKDVPTQSSRLIIQIPKNIKIKTYQKNVTSYKIDSTESLIRYEWTASYKNIFRDEIFSDMDNKQPLVLISPEYFTYGLDGCSKDWASFGNWQYRLNAPLDDLPENEKKIISQLIRGITDKKEIVRILYHYLQDHTRYINVSINIGGCKPYPASYVADNKYGDCKALTNYMKAMLNFAGIKSHYTLIYADEQPKKLISNIPGAQFNHVILTVPLGKDTVWLENTSNTNPFGYIGTFTQNRQALLIDENNSRAVKIPGLRKSEVLVTRNVNFTFNDKGYADAKASISYGGMDYESFNYVKSDMNKTEQDEIIRKHLPFSNFDVIKWDLHRKHRDTARIELTSSLNLYKVIKPLGNESYFTLLPTEIPDFTPPSDRILPVSLPYPIYQIDSLIYNIPSGYELKSAPADISLSGSFGTYELQFKPSGTSLYITKKFVLFSGNYSIEQYKNFYDFLGSIKKEEKKIILLRKKV
jgi:transglutaminase-like putative cysteine protease